MAYLSDISFTHPEAEEDNTIELTDPDSTSQVKYTIEESVTSGSTITFSVYTNEVSPYYIIRVYGVNTVNSKETETKIGSTLTKQSGTNTYTVTFTGDYEKVRISVQFADSTGGTKYVESDYTSCVAYLSDISVTQ